MLWWREKTIAADRAHRHWERNWPVSSASQCQPLLEWLWAECVVQAQPLALPQRTKITASYEYKNVRTSRFTQRNLKLLLRLWLPDYPTSWCCSLFVRTKVLSSSACRNIVRNWWKLFMRKSSSICTIAIFCGDDHHSLLWRPFVHQFVPSGIQPTRVSYSWKSPLSYTVHGLELS